MYMMTGHVDVFAGIVQDDGSLRQQAFSSLQAMQFFRLIEQLQGNPLDKCYVLPDNMITPGDVPTGGYDIFRQVMSWLESIL